MTKRISTALASALSISSSLALAQDISIMLPGSYLTETAEQIFSTDVLQICWRSTLARTDDTSFHMRVRNVICGSEDAPPPEARDECVSRICVDFDTTISCSDYANPEATSQDCDADARIAIDVANFSVRGTGSAQSDSEAGNGAESNVRELAVAASERLTCLLHDALGIVNTDARPVCPRIWIDEDVNINLELDFRYGCITGHFRKELCHRPAFGPGTEYECQNGRWKAISSECDIPESLPGPDPKRGNNPGNGSTQRQRN